MNSKSPIYTEKNNCQDCYKCLRQCPVKAIKIEEASASVIPEDCIFCGHCVQVCPVGAKKVRNDLPGLITSIETGNKVIACVAPSWLSDFPEISPSTMIGALKKLGFYGVSETALGAELVAKETANWLINKNEGAYISSCCTSIVQMVHRHYPHLSEHLIPLLSPMQSHAKMLKNLYGEDFQVAFFGPCIAKKSEHDENLDLTDFVLTFADLHNWLNRELPNWNNTATSTNSFIPYSAGKGNYFPVDGGMIANLKENPSLTEASYMSFSGVNHIKDVLNDLQTWKPKGKLFLELLLCEGGCIKGPATINKDSVAHKRQSVLGAIKNRTIDRPDKGLYNIYVSEKPKTDFRVKQITEIEIENALKASGKFTKSDELNCSGCGYDSCRDFAVAMLTGKAERIMCVSYTRKVAQDKASVLLKKIPYGVVVVDENLSIIDSNRKFAEILGGEAIEVHESVGNLDGADLKKLLFFHKLFTTVLHTGEEMIEHRIRGNGLFLHVSVVSIQPYKIVCGILQNMQDPEIRKDMVVNSIREVIHENMNVVQKIAFLLGENSSYTESMLNSIIEPIDQEITPTIENQ